MPENLLKTSQVPHKDSDLPINDLSVERTAEIEAKVLPGLMEVLEKLKKENPELFKNPERK